MKKILLILIVIILIFTAKNKYEEHRRQTHAEDLSWINKLISACSKTAASEKIFEATPYVYFDAGYIDSENSEPFIYMRSLVGNDFKSRLSNGDTLWFLFDLENRTFEIYADDPEIKDNMIYPNWKYSKIIP